VAFCGVKTGGDEDLVLKSAEEGGVYEVGVEFCGDGHDEIVECS
jgi:predicted RNA-binding protein with TRAM domain